MVVLVKISDVLQKHSAILYSDGLVLLDKLNSINADSMVISFEGISHFTPAFLNASIGKYLNDHPDRLHSLKFAGVFDEYYQNQINYVVENAQNRQGGYDWPAFFRFLFR